MRLLLPALASIALHAAVIRGTAVENQTSRPVAGTTVQLQPLPGTGGQTVSTRANRFGVFEFGGVAAGTYLVKASRNGFLPAEYGQKRWNSAGAPLTVQAEETATLTVRLWRYGAISGTVVDENEVGLPDHPVVVYRATEPPGLVTAGRGDERGIYRIPGLEPGTYLVRTRAKQDGDEQYVPTFARETLRVEEARAVTVYPEEETRNADIHALPGRLYSVAGLAVTVPAGIPVKVTLVSDMGRQTVEGPAFHFTALPAGPYELFAEAAENPGLNIRAQAAYMPLPLDRDVVGLRLPLQEIRESRFEFAPAGVADPNAMQVLARRKDLAGTLPPQRLQLANGRVKLAPGHWELSVTPPPGFYVSGFQAPTTNPAPRNRPDGWNELSFPSVFPIRFALSSGGGALRGVVKIAGTPAAGAPVYLEAYDPANRRRVAELRRVYTDPNGAYQFHDLPPGTYRILATSEYQDPDSATLDLAGARSIQIEERHQAGMDLDLYSLP